MFFLEGESPTLTESLRISESVNLDDSNDAPLVLRNLKIKNRNSISTQIIRPENLTNVKVLIRKHICNFVLKCIYACNSYAVFVCYVQSRHH